jgi:hypothetical protein
VYAGDDPVNARTGCCSGGSSGSATGSASARSRRACTPRSETRAYLGDAVFVTPQRIAIEVELTLKSRARLDAIVRDLGETYPQVWYFAAPKLIPTLEEIATVARWQNVRVHRYPALTVEAAVSAQLV